jgi:hypothetical protein
MKKLNLNCQCIIETLETALAKKKKKKHWLLTLGPTNEVKEQERSFAALSPFCFCLWSKPFIHLVATLEFRKDMTDPEHLYMEGQRKRPQRKGTSEPPQVRAPHSSPLPSAAAGLVPTPPVIIMSWFLLYPQC